jgi:hypothetical protein
MEFYSSQLTDFNLEGQIVLSEKFGLIKIARSEDGLLILVSDGEYGMIDQEKTTPTGFVKTDSLLGFILDIGIQKTKQLTYGEGFYFGSSLIKPQSSRSVSQTDFDKELFENIGSTINLYYQSGDKQKELESIRVQLLIDEYNNARLLFPNFYAESYLSLMRIIDALANAQGGYDFATYVAGISTTLNQDIYGRISSVGGYKGRISKASVLFNSCLEKAKKKKFPCYDKMSKLDEAGHLVFACMFSAYKYRNKFVHKGFPFPDTVVRTYGDLESGLAYLNPSVGISWSKFNRPTTEFKDGDLIDVHEIVGDESKVFKDTYFLLLPTWHFLKRIAREAILSKTGSM